jgi:uncharacterized protein
MAEEHPEQRAPRAEPAPADPAFPRYTAGPFPAYRFIPGLSPHPRRSPRGHSWGRPEPRVQALDPEAWASCPLYLRGVDLFNHAYWWESHEAFEALWRGHVPDPTAVFFQGLIQIAAAELKRLMGSERAAQALYGRGLTRLRGVASPFLGLDVARFVEDVEARRVGARDRPARIDLAIEGPTRGSAAGPPP